MVAVHALDGEGYARCSLTASILTTVTAVIIVVIIVALMAMTLTVLAMTLFIVTVTALLAFLFVAVTSAGTVTTEAIPECVEQQADEQDGRGDAPPRSSVLMTAIGGDKRRCGKEPLRRQELVDDDTKEDATRDDGS